MAHNNTIFAQMLKLVSRHEFESLANSHHEGQRLRKMTRWSQFVALSLGQLAQRISLRDICHNLQAQSAKLYHLGCASVSRSSLSRVNEQQPYTLYETLFAKLLCRCQGKAPGHRFRFKNKLISLDATTIDLCLSLFPWADFRRSKGGIKLHVGLDHAGYLPSFVQISEAKIHDVTIARGLELPAGSIVVCDRGYVDYAWFNQLNDKGVYFVTRLKRNARYRITQRRAVNRSQGLRCDQRIRFTGFYAQQQCSEALRRISYRDPETGKRYEFLTNHFTLSAKTIADIYKARWQIEIFFKWIKQNLKIKSFLGTSKNAVLTQIWVAMCIYLLLAFIKFSSQLGMSLQAMTRLLQLNLFERRALLEIIKPQSRPPTQDAYQLVLGRL